MAIELLDETGAAEYLGVSRSLLQKWRHFRKGPVYVKIGRYIRYDPRDLEKYILSQKIDPAACSA